MRRRRRSSLGPIIIALVAVVAVIAAWRYLPTSLVAGIVGVQTPTAAAVSRAPGAATAGVPSGVSAGTPAPGGATATPAAGRSSGTPVPGAPAPAAAPTAVAALSPTPTLPEPDGVARQYLQLWEQRQYAGMYALLSKAAKAEITEEKFVSRYRAIMDGATIVKITTRLDTAKRQVTDQGAQIPVQVDLETGRVGMVVESNVIRLVAEDGAWRIAWTPDLIFRDMGQNNRVLLYPFDPVRGSIVDRAGKPLAVQDKVVTLGLIPGRIQDEPKALATLSGILGLKPEEIKQKYARAQPDWWVPLKDYPKAQRPDLEAKIKGTEGVLVEEKEARVYPRGSVAGNVIGFVGRVTAEDLKEYGQKGYEEGEIIGRTGVEASAEEVLAGVRGGKLAIVNPDGDIVRTIGERAAQPGGTVHLSIDIEAQDKAEKALGDKTGSLVLMDPRDNSVIALASTPSYDPNLFILGISDEDWKRLSTDPRRPFQNRPTLSAYPTGSVFKVITMAAGIERGGYKPSSQFVCKGSWDVLDKQRPFGDWVPQGHGQLDLSQGLVESCNIVFYEIGHKLDQIDPNILPEFARQFGFGEPTGINGLPEAEGNVPDTAWKQKTLNQGWYPGDAVNLAIGQGYLEATPLQLANAYAAIANGGTLKTPLLIREVTYGDVGKQQKKTFTAQEKKRLGVSGPTLQAIREAMKRVASTPKGTANYAFKGYGIPTAAKTGSAENQSPDAHAWFAGFAPADNPTVVVVAMVEGGRVGSEVAAPIGRNILDAYLGAR